MVLIGLEMDIAMTKIIILIVAMMEEIVVEITSTLNGATLVRGYVNASLVIQIMEGYVLILVGLEMDTVMM